MRGAILRHKACSSPGLPKVVCLLLLQGRSGSCPPDHRPAAPQQADFQAGTFLPKEKKWWGGLARTANLPPLEEGPEHHRASETLAKLVPAPYCPRRWCWCQTAPYTRRRESWLLTKYSFSLVREPAAAQLPTHGLGLLSCLPPALTLAESDTVAKPTALS